jgi:hypothetical protein
MGSHGPEPDVPPSFQGQHIVDDLSVRNTEAPQGAGDGAMLTSVIHPACTTTL